MRGGFPSPLTSVLGYLMTSSGFCEHFTYVVHIPYIHTLRHTHLKKYISKQIFREKEVIGILQFYVVSPALCFALYDSDIVIALPS